MKRKILRSLWIIPVIIGIFLIIFGITKVVKASSMPVTHVGDSNWFIASSSKNSTLFAGIGMIIGGVFLSVGLGTILFLIFKYFTMTPDEELKTLDKVKEYNKKIYEAFSDITTESKKEENEVICDYCGSRISKEDRECPNCGAKVKGD